MKLHRFICSLFVVATIVTGCGDSSIEQAELPTENDGIYVPTDVSCDKAVQTGFYQAMLIRDNGECPDFPPFIIHMDEGERDWGTSCQSQSVSFTHGECKQESVIVCEDDNVRVTVTTEFAQIQESGVIMAGKVNIVKELKVANVVTCESNYRSKIERVR